MSYEESLTVVEAATEAAVRAGENLVKQLRGLSRAAKIGDVRAVARHREQAVAAATDLAPTVGAVGVQVTQLLEAFSRTPFPIELAAELRGLGYPEARELDGRVYVYPFILQFDPLDKTVRVGRQKERGIRPSHVGQLLKRLRGSPSQSLAAVSRLLESLEKAYLLQTGGVDGQLILLRDLYDIFVMRPGQQSEYSESDFVRDLYGLEVSGVTRTPSGREISFAASTTTRGGRGFRVVTREGEERIFSAVRFDAASQITWT